MKKFILILALVVCSPAANACHIDHIKLRPSSVPSLAAAGYTESYCTEPVPAAAPVKVAAPSAAPSFKDKINNAGDAAVGWILSAIWEIIKFGFNNMVAVFGPIPTFLICLALYFVGAYKFGNRFPMATLVGIALYNGARGRIGHGYYTGRRRRR